MSSSSRIFAFLIAVAPLFSADSALLFNKTFGGTGNDYVNAIATDPSGYVIVGGTTSSYDFSVTDRSTNRATQFAVTTDSGATWQAMGNLPQGLPYSLAVAPGSPSAWYAAGNGGIFKSVDNGATWTTSLAGDASKCGFYPPNCGAKSLVVDPTTPSTVYAVVDGAIMRTTDAGVTWTAAIKPPLGPNSAVYFLVDPFHPTHFFTGSGTNFRSFDAGQSWTQYVTPPRSDGSDCSSGTPPLAFDPVAPNLAYIAQHCSIYRSTDGGVSWSHVATPFATAFNVATGPKMVYATADGLYASADQGVTWTLLQPKGNPPFVATDPARPSVVIAGVFRSVDGGATLTPLPLGRNTTAIVFDPSHRGVALAASPAPSTGYLAKLDSAGTILAATYFGGLGGAAITGVATGADGTIYVTGSTLSRDFPVTPGAWLTTPPANGTNYFVGAFDPDLQPVYATYLRGSISLLGGIAVDPNGNAVVAGIGGNSKCFVTKLKADGSGAVFESTFGSTNGDYCGPVATDAAGNSIVVGNTFSRDFPLTGAGVQTHPYGDRDAIVAKLDPAGNLIYSGYLGGKGVDAATAVAVDSAGNIYVAGNSGSKDFPITPGAYQTSLSSNCPYASSSFETGIIGTISYSFTDDVFLTKLDPAGNLINSTYLGGGCYDVPTSMAIDAQGNVWITGTTDSDPFPQAMPFESGPRTTYYKAFVSELDAASATLKLSSYLTAGLQPAIAVDPFGDAYVGGSTTPVQSPYGGPPAPPPVVTGVHGSLAKIQPRDPGPLYITSAGNLLNLRSGPVSPGQITLITAAGLAPITPKDFTFTPDAPLPRALAGIQVLFDTEPAAIVSIAPGRVLVVAPYDLAGRHQTSIQLAFNGTLSPAMIAEIAPDPAYLSLDGSGTGQAYAVNPDGSLNSVTNPAPEASQVTVYVTGTGIVDPKCPEGGGGAGPPKNLVCGVSPAIIQTPNYAIKTMTLPYTSLTIAVK